MGIGRERIALFALIHARDNSETLPNEDSTLIQRAVRVKCPSLVIYQHSST